MALATEEAFTSLKRNFITIPILHADTIVPLVVAVNAYRVEVGATLYQRHLDPPQLHLVVFFNKNLTLLSFSNWRVFSPNFNYPGFMNIKAAALSCTVYGQTFVDI